MSFTLNNLNHAEGAIIEELQTSGATHLVKNLQMLQLQRVVLAVGIFSIFEAMLQDKLQCGNGFREAKSILEQSGEQLLSERFLDIYLAINVLKHGRGRSYEQLLQKADSLSFRIKLQDEALFSEGDIAEVSTLIEVNDAFIEECVQVIKDVSIAVRIL